MQQQLQHPVLSQANSLLEALAAQRLLRVLEAHNPCSALVASAAVHTDAAKNTRFDAIWSSSLTDSIVRGCPDIEYVSIKERLRNIADIKEVTSLPIIMDADTGGLCEHFELNVRSAQKCGVAALIIEDKVGLKKNSLLGVHANQQQATVADFSEKIQRGCAVRGDGNILIIARIESLILEAGMTDALMRADAYVAAGADGIMIHSRRKTPDEIFQFAEAFRRDHPNVPLVCVPTSYTEVEAEVLADHGFNIVIYANHLLRSSFSAMKKTAETILQYGRTYEAETFCLPIENTLSLVPGTR